MAKNRQGMQAAKTKPSQAVLVAAPALEHCGARSAKTSEFCRRPKPRRGSSVLATPSPAAKECESALGDNALSLRGIREVQPHLSPDRGDGDIASSHETKLLSTTYRGRRAQKPGYPHINAGYAPDSPQMAHAASLI